MPKIVDHEQYRAELLDRSFELFARHGFAAVTMRKLAAELGVSTGTLYHYFSGKEELFEQMAERVAGTNLEVLVREIARVDDLDTRLDLLETFLTERGDLLWNGLAMLIEFRRVAGGEAAQRALAGYRSAVREAFPDLPEAFAEFFFSALMGSVIEAGVDPDAVDPARRLARIREALVLISGGTRRPG